MNISKISDLCKILRVLDTYSWLTDAYTIDFYVEDYWSKLPSCWRKAFDNISVQDMAPLVDFDTPLHSFGHSPIPLSLLSLHAFVRNFMLSRAITDLSKIFGSFPLQSALFDNVKRKHVKPKKQHEIERVLQVVSGLKQLCAGSMPFSAAVDFGSGLGHMSRILSLHLDLQVTCIESNNILIERANKFDQKLKSELSLEWSLPTHQSKTVNLDENDSFFSRPYCLLGLHACGDLSASLLKQFVKDPNACALVSVGCCYMKLNGGIDKVDIQNYSHITRSSQSGYPLSTFLSSLPNANLSYAARELACHAVEQYREKLKSAGDLSFLRAHTYRALLEWIIIKTLPEKRKAHLKMTKNAHFGSFENYLNLILSKNEELSNCVSVFKNDVNAENFLSNSLVNRDRVAIFYILRLIIAPLIETVILYDRLLYLDECHFDAQIVSIFDPILSPRCFAVIANKR